MKYSIFAILAIASLVSTVSAATGSTSTGSTSTGSTSTGSTSTGTISTPLTCLTGLPCAGGPTRAFNYTKNANDLYPQCFPWVWLLDFYKGNIFMIYENQKVCQKQRLIDFRM